MPINEIIIENQVVLIGFSPIQTHPIIPAIIGEVDRSNNVDATEVFNIAKT